MEIHKLGAAASLYLKMDEIIKNTIEFIEKTHNVKIIFMCEYGSRAWDFASQDSDYDLRGVYVNAVEDMLRIDRPASVIDYKNDEQRIDLSLWSVQKFGALFCESNPSVFEWLQCKTVHRIEEDFATFFKSHVCYFDRNRLRAHYVSMARSNFARLKACPQEAHPVKKYLYVLRAIACVACIDAGDLPGMRWFDVAPFLPAHVPMAMLVLAKVAQVPSIPVDNQLDAFIQTFISQNKRKKDAAKTLSNVEYISNAVIQLAVKYSSASEIEMLRKQIDELDNRPPGCDCSRRMLERWGCDCGAIDDDGKFTYEDPENPYMFCEKCDYYHAKSKKSCRL